MAQYTKKQQAKMDEQSFKIAQGIKQADQSKNQTKHIAQGIRKGIEIYKSQQNKKLRDIDKQRKKSQANTNLKNSSEPQANSVATNKRAFFIKIVPWLLLLGSWGFFIAYLLFQN